MRKLSLLGKTVLCGALICIGSSRPAAADSDSWYEKIALSGDFRYRFENIQEDKKAERDRQRIRLRLNLEALLDDYWKVGTQVTTGGLTDPVSTNQTLGDDFNRKPIDLSQAYLEYKALFNNLKLTAGKAPNPFVNVGKNQLIWDGDLTFEGISGNAGLDILSSMSVFLNGAGFWIREQSAGFDPMLYGAQAGLKGTFGDMKYTLGGSYYLYQVAQGQKTFVDNNNGFGNSTVDASTYKTYRYNYKIAEAFFELGFILPFFELPATVFGNAVKNTDDSVSVGNTAYNAGITLNKAKAEGSWQFTYYFRRLDCDAVIGAYTDSDFGGGGTNSLGNVFQAAYMITDAVQVQATHTSCQKDFFSDAGRKGYHRTQLDFVLKF